MKATKQQTLVMATKVAAEHAAKRQELAKKAAQYAPLRLGNAQCVHRLGGAGCVLRPPPPPRYAFRKGDR